MTILIAFFTAHLGAVLVGLGSIAALLGAWFRGKSTGAAQQAVKTQAVQTQLDQHEAAQVLAEAQGKADAAQAVGVAMQDRAQAQSDAAALAPGAAAAELKANWSAKE